MRGGGVWLNYQMHTSFGFCPYYPRGDKMDKDKQKQLNQKKSNAAFNSTTEKSTPENQNQTHNSRREGMGPNTKRKPS